MQRRLRNIFRIAWVLAVAAVAALWLRSYWRSDLVVLTWLRDIDVTWRDWEGKCLVQRDATLFARSNRGMLMVTFEKDLNSLRRPQSILHYSSGSATEFIGDVFTRATPPLKRVDHPLPAPLDRIGIDLVSGSSWFNPNEHTAWRFRMPLWLFIVPLVPVPLRWLGPWWKLRRRKAKGLCLQCGYDLRATPNRCPECGAVPGRKKPERRIRLGRWIERAIVAASVILMVPVAGMWWRSSATWDQLAILGWRGETPYHCSTNWIRSDDGALVIGRIASEARPTPQSPDVGHSVSYDTGPVDPATWAMDSMRLDVPVLPLRQVLPACCYRAGFEWSCIPDGYGLSGTRVRLPWWFLAMLAALAPVRWVIKQAWRTFRRWRRWHQPLRGVYSPRGAEQT